MPPYPFPVENEVADNDRIEDNLLVTETGYENLTTVPKVLEEVELIVTGQ